MKLMILAGEVSGDAHAAALVKELKKRSPSLKFFGMGGSEMEAEGVRLLYSLKDLSVLGLSEVLKKYFHFRRIFKHLKETLAAECPDALILVDFPGFNVRFARVAKKQGVRVLYYVSPQIWAWGRRRRHTIARRVDKMLVLFPFEKEVYDGTGLDVEYVGHPTLDRLGNSHPTLHLREAVGAGVQDRLVGLLPGSRPHEVERLFPVMLEAARQMAARNPALKFVASAFNAVVEKKMNGMLRLQPAPVHVIREGALDIMKQADLVVVASGTATLECALVGTPMLIVYQVSPLTWTVGRMVVKLPYIGLANVMAGKKIVPEFLQRDAKPEAIATEALSLLDSKEKRSRMVEELKKVKAALGQPGASGRAAEAVLRGMAS